MSIFFTGLLNIGILNTPKSRLFSSHLKRKMFKLLEKEDVKPLVENIDNFLFDCDGVLWGATGTIPGSLETIVKLKELGKRVYYVTNNSSKSRSDYLAKCKDLGFPAEEDDIVCTAYMAAQYLKMKNFKGKVYLVGRDESLGKELDNVGIPYIGTGPDAVNDRELPQFLQTQLDPEVNCVMVGFDPHISYMKIMKAASYLKNSNCLFIGTNKDPCLPNKGHMKIPGTGCMVLPVSLAAERDPIVMGKPETAMFDVLRDLHGLDPSRSLMTGDTLSTDIIFAKKCGMKSLLVLTGNATQQDVVKANAETDPDFYSECLGTLGKLL